MKGKMNYLVDFVFDEQLKNPMLDELSHFAVEMGMGRGSARKRAFTWGKKALKYRLAGQAIPASQAGFVQIGAKPGGRGTRRLRRHGADLGQSAA